MWSLQGGKISSRPQWLRSSEVSVLISLISGSEASHVPHNSGLDLFLVVAPGTTPSSYAVAVQEQ